MSTSIVQKLPPSPLVILRRVYLNIAQGNHCAAKLIEYFKHWREWKIAHQRTEWIYQPLKRIHEDLMGEHSLHVIRAAIALLEKLGILERRRNPGNGQDKTWQYRLKVEILEQLLKPEAGTLRSEHSENTVEQQPHDLSSSSLATTTVVVEEEAVAEVKRAIADSPFMQESSDIDSPPQPTKLDRDKFSAPPNFLYKSPNSATDLEQPELGRSKANANTGSQELPNRSSSSDSSNRDLVKCSTVSLQASIASQNKTASSQKQEIVFPNASQLKLNRVDLNDEDLLRVASAYHHQLQDAVDAWLEWARTCGAIDKPTRSLIGAIVKGWKPEKSTTRAEIKPLPPGILEQLKQKFRTVLEIPFNGSWCWGVIVGSHGGSVLPWWEALLLGGTS